MGLSVGVLRLLAEQRSRHIVAHARPYLEEGEEVVHWVRARRTNRRGDGFAFLTDRRFVVHWTGRSDGHGAVEWKDIQSWAVKPHARGGPILAVETGAESHLLQMPVMSKGMAENVRRFLNTFAGHAPQPRRALASGDAGFSAQAVEEVGFVPRTLLDHTKRVAVTVLGLTVLVFALVIVPLPGPWSILLAVAGLAVLASEYDWAKDALGWSRQRYKQAVDKLRQRRELRRRRSAS